MSGLHPFVVLLAGGQGTRLWPLSRRDRPKQFLDLTGNGHSLLQDAMRRALTLCGSPEKVLVVSLAEHAGLVRQQLPDLPESNLLLEPVGRNTAASLGLAALHLERTAPGSLMLCLPVDHLFADERPWLEAADCAMQAADQTGALTAIGLKPARADSAYGYQRLGVKLDLSLPLDVFQLTDFVEKPSLERAQAFVEGGEYLWNTGTYAWKVDVFIQALTELAPELLQDLRTLSWPLEQAQIEKVYARLAEIPVDRAVIEKAGNRVTIQAAFERIDVGSLASLAEIWSKDSRGNASLGDLLCNDSQGNTVFNPDGLVALVGVDDLVVVKTDQVILVCPRDRVAQVKEVVNNLRDRGMERYL